jgi:hypothetical protein
MPPFHPIPSLSILLVIPGVKTENHSSVELRALHWPASTWVSMSKLLGICWICLELLPKTIHYHLLLPLLRLQIQLDLRIGAMWRSMGGVV